MKHTSLIPFAALWLVAVPLTAQAPTGPRANSEIATSGTGETTLSPQRAVLNVGVTTHAGSAADASSRNARALNAVIDSLVRAGFARESLQTVAFGVGPNFDYEAGKKLVDYEAHAAVRLRIRELNRVGRLIDMALAAGATDVGSIGFESDSMEIARQQALGKALGKAQGDASALARAAGGSLGRLLEVRSGDGYYAALDAELEYASAGFGVMRAQSSITPREVVVRVAIQARWEFVPGSR